jgi:N-acetylglucosamine-6-phosphate deacetylase
LQHADFLITNSNALIGDKFIKNSTIYVSKNKIIKIDTKSHQNRDAIPNITTIDAKNNFVIPGFVDLQINGNHGALFSESNSVADFTFMLKPHLKSGTTSAFVSLISPNEKQIFKTIEIFEAANNTLGSQIVGLHLEGPLLSKYKSGIHNVANFTNSFSKVLINKLGELTSNFKVLITLAPEEISFSFLKQLLDKNIKIAIGHSKASFERTQLAIELGVELGTHIFNASEPIGGRSPGLTTSLLLNDKVYVSMIADSKHLHSATVEVIKRIKPHGKLILVSDSICYKSKEFKEIKIGDNIVVKKNGVLQTKNSQSQDAENFKLAGSAISLIDAVKICRDQYGFSLAESINMASLNPAKLLKMDSSIGSLNSGSIANLVILDQELNVMLVISDGKIVKHSRNISILDPLPSRDREV